MKLKEIEVGGRLRKCVAWKEVYSPKLGKKVRRCAKYAPVR